MEPTLYEEHPLQSVKSLTTVDHSQISEQLQAASSNYWLTGETPPGKQLEFDVDDWRHQGPSMSSTHAINPVVPSVVEEKAAEEDDAEAPTDPTRRRCHHGVSAARTTTTIPSSSRLQAIYQQPFYQHARVVEGHATPADHSSSAGIAFSTMPEFIPSSVFMPKDEPQTVPSVGGGRRDKHRLERKRELNRLAAQKCRQRKVEQLTLLQERVNKLNQSKAELERIADGLRRTVDALNRHLRLHINSGCRLAHLSADFHVHPFVSD